MLSSERSKTGKVEFKMSHHFYMFGEGPWPLSEDAVVKISGQTLKNSGLMAKGVQ